MEKIYCIKFITFELNMLYIPVPINPADDEKATVSNSGTEVAKPAIFPDAFAPKFNSCDIFLNTGTSKYLAIITYILN